MWLPSRSAPRRLALAGGVAAACIVVAAVPAPLSAQGTGTIQGRIASTNDRPLDVVTVRISGTRIATRTREDGLYVLSNVPAGTQVLRVVRIGYAPVSRSVTVAAGDTTTLDLQLTETPFALDELVVTGTAVESRKKEIGNSLSAISSQEIERVPVFDAQDIIRGRATGVTVLANSGQPGTGGSIRLRGNQSVSQSNNPIVYVDGIRIYSEDGPPALAARQGTLAINDIPADDIERIEIVKGAAATTLYGTEASSGVIQIFTKRGSQGAPVWDATLGFGYNDLDHVGPGGDQDPTGLFLKVCRDPALLVDTDGKPFVDPTCPASGSWLRKGLIQRYSLGVRGGTETFSYAMSGNFSGEDGVIETGYARQGGFRGNVGFSPHPRLNLQLSTGYTKKNIRWFPDGNNAGGFLLNVVRGPFNNYKGGNQGECDGVTITCVTNRYVLDELDYNRSDHFTTGLTLNWNTTDKLTNRVAIGYDYLFSDDQSARPFGNLRSPLGFIWKVDWLHTKLSLDYAGAFKARFGGAWESTSSWGGQYFQDRDNYARVDGDDFSGPGDPTVASAARNTVLAASRLRVVNAGFFAQQQIGFRDRLFLIAGARVDGNSAFGDDFGLQVYPKASLAYTLSEESWWPKRTVETFKLRFAAGESGKAPGAFDAIRTWTPVAGDDGSPAFTPAQIGNPALGPERTREIEAGFDLAALDGRVGLSATGYRSRTYDALIPVNYAPTLGFTNAQLENVGTIQNQGLEFTVDANLVRNRNFDWRSRLNLSLNRSEAIDLGGRIIDVGGNNQVREGYPVPSYFGPRITNPEEFADPIIEQDAYLGRNYPNRITSLQTSFRLFDRLTVDAMGEWQNGGYLMNWVGYQNARRGIWRPCFAVQARLRAAKAGDASALNDVRALDRYRCGSDAIDRTVINNAYWTESSDFFKLRTVSVSYDLPRGIARWLNARTGSVTLAARNLFTVTDYTGTDPESFDALDSNGTRLGRRDYYNLPALRSFLFSVRFGF